MTTWDLQLQVAARDCDVGRSERVVVPRVFVCVLKIVDFIVTSDEPSRESGETGKVPKDVLNMYQENRRDTSGPD